VVLGSAKYLRRTRLGDEIVVTAANRSQSSRHLSTFGSRASQELHAIPQGDLKNTVEFPVELIVERVHYQGRLG
jgi:hypothetical protein